MAEEATSEEAGAGKAAIAAEAGQVRAGLARIGPGQVALDKAVKGSGQGTGKAKATGIMATGIWRIENSKGREDRARKALICPKSL